MNKNELISAMSGASNLSQTQCTEALQIFINTVTNELKSGSEVKIIGFGTFKTSIRKASQGRNPRTNEVIQIPQSTRPKFTAGKGLKEAVNNAG